MERVILLACAGLRSLSCSGPDDQGCKDDGGRGQGYGYGCGYGGDG